MNLSIGTDIVEVSDFMQHLASPSFLKRTFTLNEIMYCQSKPRPQQHFSARFAAKEAFMKAVGIGWDQGLQWNHIEILHTPNNQPYIHLKETAQKMLKDLGFSKTVVTMSHSANYATATVLICS